MKHIVCFSGGKDSTALVLWAKENLPEFTAVFCDTGWEHPITYAYVEEINQTVLGGKLVTLKSEKYPDGFVQLCCERKMVPGVRTRFCTQELKIFPLHKYYESLDDGEIYSYQGIRADESHARSCMSEEEFLNDAGGYTVKRPLLRWTAEMCFEMMQRHGVKPNPLYLLGSKRVGCFPCIMTGLGEMKRIMQFHPEIRERLIDLERRVNVAAGDKASDSPRSFFRTDTIPPRFCSQTMTAKDGRIIPYPTAEDVFRYIESVDENQLPLLPARTCMSVYNLCE